MRVWCNAWQWGHMMVDWKQTGQARTRGRDSLQRPTLVTYFCPLDPPSRDLMAKVLPQTGDRVLRA